jgi:hypothetical protein
MMNSKTIALFLALVGIVPLEASFVARGVRSAQRAGHVATAASRVSSAAVATKRRNTATQQNLKAAVQATHKPTGAQRSNGSTAFSKGVDPLGIRTNVLAAANGVKTRAEAPKAVKKADSTPVTAAAIPAQNRFIAGTPADINDFLASLQSHQTALIQSKIGTKNGEPQKKTKNKTKAAMAATATEPVGVDIQPAAKAVKTKKSAPRGPLSMASLRRAMRTAAPQLVAKPQASAHKNQRTPLVVHPELLPSLPTPMTIKPLNHEVDVFAMPMRPALMSESQVARSLVTTHTQESGKALVPYSARGALVVQPLMPAQPTYRVHVPLQGMQARPYSTATAHALVPYSSGLLGLAQSERESGSGRGYGQWEEGYSWQDKALMAGAAAGAAGLMAAYAHDSKDDADAQLAINKNTINEYFDAFGNALIILNQKNENEAAGVLTHPADKIRYNQALAALEQISKAAQSQGLMPYLIEESQLPADMQSADPNSVRIIRFDKNQSGPLALEDGLDHEAQLVLSKDKNAAIGAIIAGRKITVPVCLDQNGQQVYKSFYLAFVNPDLIGDNNSMVAMRDGYNKPLIAISLSPASRELLTLAQPKNQALPQQTQSRALEAPEAGMAVEFEPAAAGSGRNLTLEALLRQSHVEPKQSGSNGLSQDLAQLDHALGVLDPQLMSAAAPVAEQVEEPKAKAKNSRLSRANPVQIAVKKYHRDIITAISFQKPMENIWAGGSTELIESFKAYNAMYTYWMNNKADRDVKAAFIQCQKQIYYFIEAVLQKIK